MRVVDEPFAHDGFALCHHPRPRRGAYVLAGHLHPCVGIGGRAFDHLRLPCFWLGDDVGVLPAFGAFTGMHPIRAGASDRVFRDRRRRRRCAAEPRAGVGGRPARRVGTATWPSIPLRCCS